MEKSSNRGRRTLPAVALVGATLLMNGCMLSFAERTDETVAEAQAAVVEPQQPVDAVLAGLSSLPTGEVVSLASGETAAAADPYFAASGRECRFVTVMAASGQGRRLLACIADASWSWQRDVLPK